MIAGRLPILAAVAAGAVLLATAAPAEACPGSERRASQHTPVTFEDSVVCQMNKARGGRGALRPDERLHRAAKGHSRNMVRLKFFSHVSPGGTDPASRIRRSGYTRGASSWAVAENLAWDKGRRSTPRAIVRAWLRSAAHRSAMLKRAYEDVGVGVKMGSPAKRSGRSSVTVTVNFGTRSG